MKDKIKELNDVFYQIFNDLNEAKPVLQGLDEAFKEFAKNILEEYRLEHKKLKRKELIAETREEYKDALRELYQTPRTWRNWKKFFRKEQNAAKTFLDEELRQEEEEFFAGYAEWLFGKKKGAEKNGEKGAEAPAPGEEPPEPAQEAAKEEAPAPPLVNVFVSMSPELNAPTQLDGSKELEEDDENGDVETETDETDEEFFSHGIDTTYEIIDGEEDETPGEEEKNENKGEQDNDDCKGS